MKPRFTTGELARLNGISKQTLIFYDRAGVFSPNEKDPYNGYRYYGADQLEMLDHILILKDMGLSLKEIRAFLSLPDPSDALDVLRRQREALAARQRRLSAALTRLNVKIGELERLETPGEVRFETLPEGWVAARPVAPPGGTLETDIALKSLLRLAHDRQLPYLYQMGTRVSREAMAEERFTEVCEVFFPLHRAVRTRLCRPRPAGLYARCLHAGPYSQTGDTYRLMLSAIGRRGLHPLDASYETCVLDSMTARSASEYLTRIDIPVGGPDSCPDAKHPTGGKAYG